MLVLLEDLLDTFDTERLKTLFIWAQVDDADMDVRVRRGCRTLREHMVHQCLSESSWMRTMLDFPGSEPMLPEVETPAGFLNHYQAQSTAHLSHLLAMSPGWFEGDTTFSGSPCSRFWVILRRLNHTAHYRGQMTILLRALGTEIYSDYGSRVDSGGPFQNPKLLAYRHPDLPSLQAYVHQKALMPARRKAEGNSDMELPDLSRKMDFRI